METERSEGAVQHENDVIAEAAEEQNGSALIDNLRQARAALAPVGKTTIIEVPGYRGMLGIEYKYIHSEETEAIGKKVSRELRAVGGQGEMLLGATDTLVAACKRVVIRGNVHDEWKPLPGKGPSGEVQLDTELADILNFPARDPREVVLGLFGSEHAIVQQSILVSRWLTDTSRKVDEDFFG